MNDKILYDQPHHIFIHVKAFMFMLVQGGLQILIISMCFEWRPVMSINECGVLTAHAGVNHATPGKVQIEHRRIWWSH